ncbi:MAG: hypothetical protein HJJLKODD_01658 [Phycisphaerae bacterium]|nr:hypothetical protein [Phycisphaerae bacterium]
MPLMSVRYKKQLEMRGDAEQALPLTQAIAKVRELATVKNDKKYGTARKRKAVDQTIDLVVHLGIDSKQADQALRGSFAMPKGIGKSKKVIAFCDGENATAAKEAGAVETGVDELVDKIMKGWLDFDVAIAHPSVMGKVGKLGKTLGPTGKMPSPKSGTVTVDVATAVREFAAGKAEYRNDAGGNIHIPVGKASFSPADLQENIEAFLAHIRRIKPASSKGQYIKRICLAGTMTPSVTVESE